MSSGSPSSGAHGWVKRSRCAQGLVHERERRRLVKRGVGSRKVAAIHEAGHVAVIALTEGFRPGDFIWHRLSHYEICYVEPVEIAPRDWEDGAARNALIARQAAMALAGGAAEAALLGKKDPDQT